MNPDYWFRVITDLEAIMSLDCMGKKVGCSDSSLCRYKAGLQEPRWSVGNRLISLHRAIAYRGVYPAPETQSTAESPEKQA